MKPEPENAGFADYLLCALCLAILALAFAWAA